MDDSREQRTKIFEDEEECIIPPALPYSVLRGLVMNRSELKELEIQEYVEWQAHDERVTHLEIVKTEHVLEREYVVWDVWTDKGRYWVITSPTNLYSQDLFPSLDYVLSFHIGITIRLLSKPEPDASQEERYRLMGAFRRWEQAASYLDKADEAEDFQAVGNRCRSCLLDLIHSIADESMVPDGEMIPKRDSFIGWAEIIADTIAAGRSAERVRGYLKSLARETWQLVNWLTHSKNAVRFDGRIAVDATGNLLQAFGAALVRYERGMPDRCGVCASYRLTSVYRPDLEIDPPFAIMCESCGAEAIRE